jgi:serine/threonine protein kinase
MLRHPSDVPVQEIPPGTTIGAFRVEGLLGRGGMATVYRAVQTRLDRPVALKVLNPALAENESLFERFKIEGINAARLDHMNIVPIYEAGEDEGYAFLAMKLIDGESFSAVIARHRVLAPDDTIRILTDVARALDYAHGRGFVHRDVKPANVLIDRAQSVFLSDFGLSKDMGARGITSTGQWMGTAEYMAPEQATGRAIDFRADLYALGCVAFECVTGDVPYPGENALGVMMAHTNADIPDASARNRSLPAAVDRVIRRAIAKDADDRYPAALAFVDSLAAAVAGRPLTPNAEPEEGFTRYSGPHTPVREPSAPSTAPDDRPSWPMSVPPGAQSPPTQLLCPNCLSHVETDDIFCGGCGVRVLWCRTCKGPRIATDRFCSHCGAVSEASEIR